MDIIKGDLETVSSSGILTSSSRNKVRPDSAVRSLEVLTPEPMNSEHRLKRKSSVDRLWSPAKTEPVNSHGGKTQLRGVSSTGHISECKTNSAGSKENLRLPCSPTDATLPESTEEKAHHKLDSAVKKMSTPDDLLETALTMEKEVNAQGQEMWKQMLEELKGMPAHSHEESLNTNRFLGLHSQVHEVEDVLSSSDGFEEHFNDSLFECNDLSQGLTKNEHKVPESAEEKTDPMLEKATKKMKTLDEILQKASAKEKEVIAQSLAIRKQLREELKQIPAQSHEESLNTNKFLALTPEPDEAQDAFNLKTDKMFVSVFCTQLPVEDFDQNYRETIQGDVSTSETAGILNSERTSLTAKQKKNTNQKKGVDFIQRNIELAKDAGSTFLTEEENLRLQQLTTDSDNDCNDEDIIGNMTLCIPGEGYAPNSAQLDRLAEIEAELQNIHTMDMSFVTNICTKNANTEPAPGENVLQDTKTLRELKISKRDRPSN
ncbi:fibrous sheath-interacting protein 1 [Spea bombifrons]|uniref:fibrous sheath-interacting protein 1 n=1 Tax=Spea bombifrons TaxID=233779 RepID=UPI002348F322|nr:fibrous sheath-interacting protein 1 [Spea bombifrons]